MTKLLIVLLCGLFFTLVFSPNCPGQKLTTKLADKSFDEFAFVDAIGLYEYAYRRDSTDNYLVKRLADANRNIGNTDQVERWLKKLVDRKIAQPEDIFNYFQALKSNGKYEAAQQWLKQYAELRPNDARVNLQASLLDKIKLLMRDSAKYEIRSTTINTAGSDMGPAFYKDRLVFSSTSIAVKSMATYKWNDLPYLKMFSAKIGEDGDLSRAESFAPKLKTEYHDGPVSIDQKNNIIYLTRNNNDTGKASQSRSEVVNLKIFIGKLEDNEWKLTGPFPYNSDKYSAGHPSVNKDGTVLYFASDMPGGYGKSDVYYSVCSNGQWSKPVNLGAKINTEENEFFPFITTNGVLYFASDGNGGMGGLDIFFSVPTQGVFNSIENMGYPVNSPKDDFGLALDSTGEKGYFTSNRRGGKGDDDIYFLKIKHIPLVVRGVVKDRETKDVLADAKISVLDEAGNSVASMVTPGDGQFKFELGKGQKYTIKAEKDLYTDNEVALVAPAVLPNDEVYSEVFIERRAEDADNSPAPKSMEEEGGEALQIIELEYLYFDQDKSELRPDAAETLDKLIALLKEFPDLEMRIESDKDSPESDKNNMQLPVKRAKAAFDYVVSKGIDPKRMLYHNDAQAPAQSKSANGIEGSEEQYERNRDTIVKVVRKGEYKGKRGQKKIFYF